MAVAHVVAGRPDRAARAERDMLIQPHPRADDRRLADHDAGAVIDEEARADLRTRVDIDAGAFVGDFRNEPRNDGGTQIVQFVCDAVVQAGDRAGIADQDLVHAARCRIAEKRRLDIAVDQAPDVAERGREQPHDGSGMVGLEGPGLALPIAEFMADLTLEIGYRGQQLGDNESVLLRYGAAEMAEATWIQRCGKQGQHPLQRRARRETFHIACLVLP